MVKNDLGYKKQNMGGEKVLFHKVIFHSYEEAINTLKSRNLAPGELAVARYYVGYDDTTLPPSWNYIRMVLAVGGATPNSNDDTYFFKDFSEDISSESITFDDLEEKLSYYYTKEDIEKLFNSDDNWKQLVNQRLGEIDVDINTLREEIKNATNVDLDDYYTKTQVDEKLSKKLESNDVSIYAKSSEVYTSEQVNNILTNYASSEKLTEVENILDGKADRDLVENLESELSTKATETFVEEYFTQNVEGTVLKAIEDANISNIVSEEINKQDIAGKVESEVDRKLEGFEGVTTETLSEALTSNEYFNTTVITPINSIETQIKEIETQIKDLDADIDGSEEEEWVID